MSDSACSCQGSRGRGSFARCCDKDGSAADIEAGSGILRQETASTAATAAKEAVASDSDSSVVPPQSEPPLKAFNPKLDYTREALRNESLDQLRSRSGSLSRHLPFLSSPGRPGRRRASVSGNNIMASTRTKVTAVKQASGSGASGGGSSQRATSPSRFAGLFYKPFRTNNTSGGNSTLDSGSEDSFRPRTRSGSFNSDVYLRPPALSVSSAASSGHAFDRSYREVPFGGTLGRNFRSSSTGSTSSAASSSDVIFRRRAPSSSSAASSCSYVDREAFLLYDEADFEEIECLLPNSIILNLMVHPEDEMFHIKRVVLQKATQDDHLPLRGCLSPDATRYTMSYVTQAGRHEDCFDESMTLRELKPFNNVLKFSVKTKEKYHHAFKDSVGKLIGKNLREFEDLRCCEVNDFRWRMKVFANRIARERKDRLEKSIAAQVEYQYPPQIVSHPNDSHHFGRNVTVRLIWDSQKEVLDLPTDLTSSEALADVARRLGKDSEGCFLKVVGRDSFLVGDHRVIDYEYIRERIMVKEIPQLIVVKSDSISIERANDLIYHNIARSIYKSQESTEEDRVAYQRGHYRNASLTAMSLNLMSFNSTSPSTKIEKKFFVTLHTLKMPPETAYAFSSKNVGIQLALFHGRQLLCNLLQHTVKCSPNSIGVVDINQTFEFDITISRLPRYAKLCIGVWERKQMPLFWVNTNVFDYKAKMKWTCTLHMWNYTQTCMPTFYQLSPLRQCVSNPDMKEAASLVISFQRESEVSSNHSIEYPVEEQECLAASVADAAASLTNGAADTSGISSHQLVGNASGNAANNLRTITKLYAQELKKIADRDPLHDITEQEKDLIWKIREYCLTRLPELLPRIVDCVDYSDQSMVLQLNSLLSRWPVLPAERALQLLDYAYPDDHVRRFAVRCLRAVNDDVILRYLLQLAQALKHESYFQCDLVEFLLERALNNQHIGHSLFWELKAEMNSPAVGLHFGLVLEAYLSAAPEHLKILMHTNVLLEKCRATRSVLFRQEMPIKHHEKAKAVFDHSVRQQFDGFHPYSNFVNPLDPGIRCRKVLLSRCRVMNSKMRPQMMAFDNVDCNFAGDGELDAVLLMYKKGDDLRQDRLTLQLLKVMDLLWKDAGLDLRMNCYRCMSTDINEGFIGVVGNAETICKIQMASQKNYRPTAAFKKGLLLSWIRSHNPSLEGMRRAQWEFTQSCAGYSVATYILGIGDRHNDNIMVKRNGQLFHIDFGHFLGNFKYKFGFKRERVPMVLSSEFVDVIKADFSLGGGPSSGADRRNFERFRSLCEEAFLTIRKHGSLIISLLAMMISTGLPELSSEQDLNIIRSTLHLDRSEDEALRHFRNDFNESLRNAWTISLDWFGHMINQGGKG